MKRFLRSGSFKTLVVIAVVVFLGVLCASVSHNASSPFTSVVGTVFSPLQKLSAIIEQNLDEVSAAYTSSSVYKEENEALKKELEECRVKLKDYDELQNKVNAYEEFYGIKQKNEDMRP